MRTTAEQRVACLKQLMGVERCDPVIDEITQVAVRAFHDLDDAIRENERLKSIISGKTFPLDSKPCAVCCRTSSQILGEDFCVACDLDSELAALRDQLRWRKVEEELSEEGRNVEVGWKHGARAITSHYGGRFVVPGSQPEYWRPLGPGPEEGK